MSKKVAIIHGSPRKKGNTFSLASIVKEELSVHDCVVDVFDAPRLSFKHPGCISCYKCQKSEEFGCHVDDEISSVVNGLPDYDAIMLATPLYWFSYPAQIKMVIDRMFSLLKFSDDEHFTTSLSGKPLALLATAGSGIEDNLALLEKQWSIPALSIGSPFLSCLFPWCDGFKPGTAGQDPKMKAKATAFAGDLLKLLQA